MQSIRFSGLIGELLGVLALAGLLVVVAACEEGGRQTTPTPRAEVSQPTVTVRVETEAVPSPTPPTPTATTAAAATVAPTATPTSTATPNAAAPVEYEVRPSDTLSEIARRFGVTTNELAEANEIENPDDIRAGAVLRIPTTEVDEDGTSPPSPTPTVEAEAKEAEQSPTPAAPALAGIAVEKVGEDFEQPVQLTHAGDGSG
ncbi:MAG: LysM domain-containing protein, partial [Chloroflexi bacterium]|nr:LysM domain-containing protein [Chloroflexota bacterium]